MRVYFTSAEPSFLRLGGVMAGACGRHEKFADLSEAGPVLAEFFPEDPLLAPLSFLIGESFWKQPPPFCTVYHYDCGASIHVARYAARRGEMRLLDQRRLGDTLLTLYRDGSLMLSAEDGRHFTALPLPAEVQKAALGQLHACGRDLLFAEGSMQGDKTYLALFDGAKTLFCGEVLGFEGGKMLTTRRAFYDVPGHIAESVWEIAEGELRLAQMNVREREGFDAAKLEERLLPFSFFQTVLARGNFVQYLSPALAARAGEIAAYLGNFSGVCVPPSVFYLAHGEINAAGLIYPETENLFRIKFFAAPLEKGKIANIVPVGDD